VSVIWTIVQISILDIPVLFSHGMCCIIVPSITCVWYLYCNSLCIYCERINDVNCIVLHSLILLSYYVLFVMLCMLCDVWFWLVLYSTVGWERLICEKYNAYERTYVCIYVCMYVWMYVCIIVLPSTVQYFPIRVTEHSIYMLANILLWKCKSVRKTDELLLEYSYKIISII